MRILIATGVYPPESGGPATYTKLLEEKLPRQGVAVTVLPFRVVRYLPKLVRHVVYFFKCLRAARGTGIIYAQDTVSVGLPAALAAVLMGKKFIVRVPGDYAWEQARQRFGVEDEIDEFQHKRYGVRTEVLRAVQKFVVRRARAVVTPSEYMKKIVSTWTDPAKVHRVYTSISLPPPVELPPERPVGFLVLSIARPVPWKGLDGIARAVEKESGWTFKVVNDLPYPQAMGWVKTADVFVLNSTYEGLSHLLVEAMALGTPVVATRVGGNPELIEDGIDGLLVPPGDDDALYVALKRVQTDKEAARARVESARAKLRQFSIETTIAHLVHLLKTV